MPCCSTPPTPPSIRRTSRQELKLRQKAARLAHALRKWQKAGRPLVGKATYQHRLAACQACEHYRPGGNLGLGECAICGCTRTKLWLANEACPHPAGPRWEAVAT